MLSIPVYHDYKNTLCVAASPLIGSGVITETVWKHWTKRVDGGLVQKGGNGRYALFAFDKLPPQYRDKIVERFGHPTKTSNPLEVYFQIEGEAREWYQLHRLSDGRQLSPEQITRYTINASVLKALGRMKVAREQMRKRMGGSSKKIWDSLASDVTDFNNILKLKFGGVEHTLPKNKVRLQERFNEFVRQGYCCLVDGRAGNTNAQVVTPVMLELWNNMFAKARHKPSYFEIAQRYKAFLSGKIEVVNNNTGEVYDPKAGGFNPISESSVRNYLASWKSNIITTSARSGDAQRFSAKTISHRLKMPEMAGMIVSVDDRQPPFWCEKEGQRLWFYNAFDIGAYCWTTWVYGDSKEGLILDFYRQMVRNYTEWGVSIPHELEGEMNLNASYVNTFLANGAMFGKVRIEANNARGKYIERMNGVTRDRESKLDDWLPRPFAQAERNQTRPFKAKVLSQNEIVNNTLRAFEEWNNSLHPDQQLHPGMTCWDVFMDKQHPQVRATNWAGILPHLGYHQRTSMRAGRISLQYKDHVVGLDGKVALGDDLIRIMSWIEGKEVDVFWLDDNNGDVLKAMVFQNGRQICELMGDLAYSRASLGRTDEDDKNREIMSAYAATVTGYINRGKRELEPITIIEKEEPRKQGRFVIKGLNSYQPTNRTGNALPDTMDNGDEDSLRNTISRASTIDRFQ